MKDRPHSEAMAEHFRADPTYAAELLAEVRREGDPAELAILLRQMATASGQDARQDAADVARKLAL
ncbi:addiction module antidote protein [Pseudomonas aeruginosa]|uniref:addiction module antidote protein n=1 Tax=Pseudomonas aeruginosa TaxID=287 RepID=UPI00180FF6D5|nr:addiction module antidote protein [Pseudomonas aeruginosa]MBX5940144.1 addiction module antidote protein [Pseudomonas aeruginosa]MDI2440370.1 addiction module antidote protein [Pseudomonas aeruginosa]HAI3085197.1 addiction module antidote protein [Escherichia coli]